MSEAFYIGFARRIGSADQPNYPARRYITLRGDWNPNRDAATEAGVGWRTFIKRLNLDHWPETERFMLKGRDGWAFGTVVRFQAAAHNLADTQPDFYWSGYYLMALLIDAARKDLTTLEAIEALAVAHLYGGLDWKGAAQQLQQMGIWPTMDS